VFNRILSIEEMEAIRSGTFAPSYSKGNYTSLPSNDDDLEIYYTPQEESDVSLDDGTRVPQTASDEYAIHQFRHLATNNAVNLKYNIRTNIPCGTSPVVLEIYNYISHSWEQINSDSTTGANTDFDLTYSIGNLTNYKNPSNYITCRVYQKAQ